MRDRLRPAGLAAGAAALLCLATPDRAQAAFTLTFVESGTDVVGTGSGSINLAALSFDGSSVIGQAAIDPSTGYAIAGAGPAARYTGVSVTPFGPGLFSFATAGSGGPVALVDSAGAGGDFLFVPAGYVSGAALDASVTFANQSFASLGMTPGIYETSWGSGTTGDRFVIKVVANPATPVPEPASLALVGLGLVALAGVRRRRTG